MRKKLLKQSKKNLTLIEFCDKYHIPDSFGVDSIPVKHPETGEKIYLIAAMMMELWYRKKPGQAGKDGQMWPLMQGLSFDPKNLEVHADVRKELACLGSFRKRSSIVR